MERNNLACAAGQDELATALNIRDACAEVGDGLQLGLSLGADRLLPLLPQAHAVGGSHAQRELLLLTARCAAAHCGDTALADALGGQLLQSRRLAHRGLSKDTQAWSRSEALAEVAMVV